MRVLINGMPLLATLTGIGNYVYYLASALRSQEPGNEWVFHYMTSLSGELRTDNRRATKALRRKLRDVPGIYPLYMSILEALFRRQTRRERFALYHETSLVPFRFDGPTVFTVYDLSILHYPDTHPRNRVKYFERYFYPRLAQISQFIAISNSVKQEMTRELGIAPERITVTPLGLAPAFSPAPPERAAPVLASYELVPGKFILSVGTAEPRKNLRGLLKAYSLLPQIIQAEYPLVIAGAPGWLLENWFRDVRRGAHIGRVHMLGYVPQSDLVALYSSAAMLVYPSLYEGFGLPPLEAMGCGCPVIASDVSSLPEVVGDAGLFVDPRSPDAISDRIRSLVEDAPLRASLRARGFERAARFRWEDCASLTLGAYGAALRGHSTAAVASAPAAVYSDARKASPLA